MTTTTRHRWICKTCKQMNPIPKTPHFVETNSGRWLAEVNPTCGCRTVALIHLSHYAPSIKTLEKWMTDDGGCETLDGCWTEPDGKCEHGFPSWLLALNMI